MLFVENKYFNNFKSSISLVLIIMLIWLVCLSLVPYNPVNTQLESITLIDSNIQILNYNELISFSNVFTNNSQNISTENNTTILLSKKGTYQINYNIIGHSNTNNEVYISLLKNNSIYTTNKFYTNENYDFNISFTNTISIQEPCSIKLSSSYITIDRIQLNIIKIN